MDMLGDCEYLFNHLRVSKHMIIDLFINREKIQKQIILRP